MSIRLEYSKAHITARIVRGKTCNTHGARSGGIIEIVARPRTMLLTSDIVNMCSTITEQGDWYVKKIIVTPLSSFKFKLTCPNHGIDFTNYVENNEILEITVKLMRFRKVQNIQKLLSRSIFKVFNIRTARVVLADIDIQVLAASLDRRLHSVEMGKEVCRCSLLVKNFQIDLIGRFKIAISSYRSRMVMYVIGEGTVKVSRIYPTVGKMIKLCEVRCRLVRSMPCIIVVI
ncbi:MAG: hypothetical protein GXO10_07815 [Crenarchaeota archaeon]|nr:hypothetical protein [Thermoproteota archaeon]